GYSKLFMLIICIDKLYDNTRSIILNNAVEFTKCYLKVYNRIYDYNYNMVNDILDTGFCRLKPSIKFFDENKIYHAELINDLKLMILHSLNNYSYSHEYFTDILHCCCQTI